MPAVRVPAPDAPLSDVMQFATGTYFGYDRHGGVEDLGALANSSIEQWRQSRSLPDSVQLIRASLFFESRRWHHYGYPPDDETEAYIRVLVEKLRVLSGGAVKADDESMGWRIRRSQTSRSKSSGFVQPTGQVPAPCAVGRTAQFGHLPSSAELPQCTSANAVRPCRSRASAMLDEQRSWVCTALKREVE